MKKLDKILHAIVLKIIIFFYIISSATAAALENIIIDERERAKDEN